MNNMWNIRFGQVDLGRRGRLQFISTANFNTVEVII